MSATSASSVTTSTAINAARAVAATITADKKPKAAFEAALLAFKEREKERDATQKAHRYSAKSAAAATTVGKSLEAILKTYVKPVVDPNAASWIEKSLNDTSYLEVEKQCKLLMENLKAMDNDCSMFDVVEFLTSKKSKIQKEPKEIGTALNKLASGIHGIRTNFCVAKEHLQLIRQIATNLQNNLPLYVIEGSVEICQAEIQRLEKERDVLLQSVKNDIERINKELQQYKAPLESLKATYAVWIGEKYSNLASCNSESDCRNLIEASMKRMEASIASMDKKSKDVSKDEATSKFQIYACDTAKTEAELIKRRVTKNEKEIASMNLIQLKDHLRKLLEVEEKVSEIHLKFLQEFMIHSNSDFYWTDAYREGAKSGINSLEKLFSDLHKDKVEVEQFCKKQKELSGKNRTDFIAEYAKVPLITKKYSEVKQALVKAREIVEKQINGANGDRAAILNQMRSGKDKIQELFNSFEPHYLVRDSSNIVTKMKAIFEKQKAVSAPTAASEGNKKEAASDKVTATAASALKISTAENDEISLTFRLATPKVAKAADQTRVSFVDDLRQIDIDSRQISAKYDSLKAKKEELEDSVQKLILTFKQLNSLDGSTQAYGTRLKQVKTLNEQLKHHMENLDAMGSIYDEARGISSDYVRSAEMAEPTEIDKLLVKLTMPCKKRILTLKGIMTSCEVALTMEFSMIEKQLTALKPSEGDLKRLETEFEPQNEKMCEALKVLETFQGNMNERLSVFQQYVAIVELINRKCPSDSSQNHLTNFQTKFTEISGKLIPFFDVECRKFFDEDCNADNAKVSALLPVATKMIESCEALIKSTKIEEEIIAISNAISALLNFTDELRLSCDEGLVLDRIVENEAGWLGRAKPVMRPMQSKQVVTAALSAAMMMHRKSSTEKAPKDDTTFVQIQNEIGVVEAGVKRSKELRESALEAINHVGRNDQLDGMSNPRAVEINYAYNEISKQLDFVVEARKKITTYVNNIKEMQKLATSVKKQIVELALSGAIDLDFK